MEPGYEATDAMFSYYLIDRRSGRLTVWDDINIVAFRNQFPNMELSGKTGLARRSNDAWAAITWHFLISPAA
jgi:hypothetical protein